MGRWIKISSFAACLLASSGADVRLEAQSVFEANKGAKRLKVLTDAGFVSTNSTSFVTLASTTITVPSRWTSARVVVRVSGESSCSGGSGYCSLQILVDGFGASPNSGFDYAFDHPGGTAWEANSLERTSNLLGPGTHTIAVQGGVVGNPTLFLDDYAVTVVLWRVS